MGADIREKRRESQVSLPWELVSEGTGAVRDRLEVLLRAWAPPGHPPLPCPGQLGRCQQRQQVPPKAPPFVWCLGAVSHSESGNGKKGRSISGIKSTDFSEGCGKERGGSQRWHPGFWLLQPLDGWRGVGKLVAAAWRWGIPIRSTMAQQYSWPLFKESFGEEEKVVGSTTQN